MMQQRRNPIPSLLAGSILLYGAHLAPSFLNEHKIDFPYLRYIFLAFGALCVIQAVFDIVLFVIPQALRYWWINRPKGRAGTARHANLKELKKHKFFTKKSRFFVGGYKRRGVFTDVESSALFLSAAGGGKTTGFVIPALLHNDDSMIVPDLKGTLACISAKHRRKKFRHDIILLNPAHINEGILGKSHRYNPLQLVADAWADESLHPFVMSDVRSIAKQLSPEVDDGGRNLYWRAGTRKLIRFGALHGVIIAQKPTLSYVHSLLSDPEHLLATLEEAKSHPALNGDFARLAKDILRKLENGNPEHIESFREGALQALDVFEPSGVLAESTSVCDFRFSQLKTGKRGRFLRKAPGKTVYIIADPTRTEDFAPWIGLISWCALTELIRAGRKNRVIFLCDEASNFRINNLPSFLTLTREYHIVIWIILQELEEWARVYGDKALATLLSQTEVKLFTRSTDQRTCELISSMLGEKSVMAKSYNLGASFFDPINRSLAETGRKIMTADEVRHTENLILFKSGMRPVMLDKAGYHEIHPWRNQAGINPLFGKKFKGKRKLRV